MERREVLQQRLEQWCAASVRALAGEPSAEYHGHYLHVKSRPLILHAPYLHIDLQTTDVTKIRGVADALALRLLHSDQQLHTTLCPSNLIERLVFDVLEQLRSESLAPKHLPGMSHNLRERFLHWANQAATSQLVENSVGLLIFTVSIMVWSRLLKLAIPAIIEETIESTRWKLATHIGKPLRAMSRLTHCQEEYAKHALEIAYAINSMIEDQNDNNHRSDDLSRTIHILSNAKLLNLKWDVNGESVLEPGFAAPINNKIPAHETKLDYRVYNHSYDKEVEAIQNIRPAQLKKLRRNLDHHVQQQSVNCHRVARYLQQSMAIPMKAGWSFGEEQGYLDSARVARLITTPNDRKLFREFEQKPSCDCVVSIVIDNSGSMTPHNLALAAMVDTLVKILGIANIRSEVLGFTTLEWNGGRVAKEWARSGKPENPGRLNSLCHTIYKSADTPWRRARPAIAGLLKSENFREGIDGEALEWAVKRIEPRLESKKIIVMVSDGSPMDTATHAANDHRYLDQHLAKVASSIESRPDIKLCAIGIGLDLSAYYQKSLSIGLEKELLTKDFMSLVDLIRSAS